MPRVEKKKNIGYALVCWMESGMTDIISLDSLKPSERKENTITKLLWHDKKNNKKEWHKIKVLKINGKYR